MASIAFSLWFDATFIYKNLWTKKTTNNMRTGREND